MPILLGLSLLLGSVPTQASTQADSTTRASRRPLSDLARASLTLASDAIHIYSSPARLNWRSALWVGGFAATGAVLYANDQEIYDAFQRNRDEPLYRPIRRVGEALAPVGHMGTMNRYYFAGLLVGYALRIDLLTEMTTAILEGHFIAGGVNNLSGPLVGRERPEAGLGPRCFDSGSSFPSGHAINIFQLATVVAHHAPHWTLDAVAYGLATTVACERITSDKHWPSDVYAGVVLGTVVARAILSRRGQERASLTLVPCASPDGWGMAVRIPLAN